MHYIKSIKRSGAHPRGVGGGGCQHATTPQNQNFKNIDFVDKIISKVLCDFRSIAIQIG